MRLRTSPLLRSAAVAALLSLSAAGCEKAANDTGNRAPAAAATTAPSEAGTTATESPATRPMAALEPATPTAAAARPGDTEPAEKAPTAAPEEAPAAPEPAKAPAPAAAGTAKAEPAAEAPAKKASKKAAKEGGKKEADAADWKPLFNGKSLDGWKVADFGGHGEAVVEEGELIIPVGEGLSGIAYSGGDVPTMNYEIEVVSKKVDGVDFFSSITFPFNDSAATFVNGGWGGTVIGISNIDGEDASANETTNYKKFERDKWYTFRLRVEPKKISVSIDGEQLIDFDPTDKELSLRIGMEPSQPLGICTWQTTAAIKSIKMRKL